MHAHWVLPAYKFSCRFSAPQLSVARHNRLALLSVSSYHSAAMAPTHLEAIVLSLVGMFKQYASKDGKGSTLSRSEFKQLMEKELSGFLQNQKDPAEVDKIMKSLDADGDGELDFMEFSSLVMALSMVCNQVISELETKK
ncbi:protein S100-A11-like [Megalops cyprinoides]|uniref:protein S100-A11-like n=1 Tax=Megalops cyprinoides TaxID=118141 RepID=UPI0018642ED3|nr:protein S100-A11-like [Megalops cyprinoides]